MVQIVQAKDISLYELEEKFGLQLNVDTQFFGEVSENLISLTDVEKQSLERVRSNYANLAKRRSMSEEAVNELEPPWHGRSCVNFVKMVVLSPLLDLAGFFQPPFEIATETSIEISAEDNGILVKGSIDVLVLQKRLWILVIESKSTRFDVMTALPQALAYMVSNPNPEKPTFGLLVNGREFVFVKLIPNDRPYYGRSDALSIEREDELWCVLSIMKHLSQLLSHS